MNSDERVAAKQAVARTLLRRAAQLEDEAIEIAEMQLDHRDWPRRSMSHIAHAELKLRAARLLRERTTL